MLRHVQPLLAAIAFATLTCFAAPAFAVQNAPEAWGAGVEVLSEEQLAEERGGFEVAGIRFNFGAVVTTYIDGIPALTTNLTWTEAGPFANQHLGAIGQPLDVMTPEQLAALGLEGFKGKGGVFIQDDGGFTAIAQALTDDALQNIIVNSASGRDLRQQIDITLELPGFESIQDALSAERLGIRLTDDLRGLSFATGGS